MIRTRLAKLLGRRGVVAAKHFRAFASEALQELRKAPRDVEEYDVVIVGGGPAGLATAIRLKQLQEEHGKDIRVCLLDKGSEIGSHILSGNCFEPSGFEKLFPDWKNLPDDQKPPLSQEVKRDSFKILFKNWAFSVPEIFLPKQIHNRGNYIISLGRLCNWMGERAQEAGVDVFSGFAADELLFDETNTHVVGVATADSGIDKNWEPKDSFQRGMELRAKQVILAEGCRGSLSERAIREFNLRANSDVQSYGIGYKEVWEVPEEQLEPGLVVHTVGWPMKQDVYSGSFMYHQAPNLIHLGFVVGLDYKNPHLNPYQEFQRWKTHAEVSKHLKNGKCIKYGARALNEGGYFAIPQLAFPGGLMVGCSAGFLNVAKIKGANNAIVSGTIAAEEIYYALHFSDFDQSAPLFSYDKKVRESPMMRELFQTRNFKGGFKLGIFPGLAHGFLTTMLLKGKEFWNIRNDTRDTAKTLPAKECTPIEYEKNDGILTFDILDNLSRSGTNHEADQPSHLRIKKDRTSMPLKSFKEFAGMEERFCPAKVYEFIKDEATGEARLQINASNCIHCKTCSIKMVDEYIDWNVPQGGEGPE